MLLPRMPASLRAFIISSLTTLVLWGSPSQGFVNSPKIITRDGNMIIESGLNRNIDFHLEGKARITINDQYDLIELMGISGLGPSLSNVSRGNSPMNANDGPKTQQLSNELATLRILVFGPEGLDARVRALQNRTRTMTQSMRRYNSRLQTVERRVQSLNDRLELDSCKSNPCENGGTCFNIFNGFMCKCSKNFEGPKCEKDVNECALFAGTDLGCQNGAHCVNQFGGYSCVCSAGWYGIHCTQRKGDCLHASAWELCGHGTCVASNDDYGYKCICDQGWRTNGLTPTCMVDVDECSETHPPCSTKCINLPGSFTCSPCSAGLTGNGITCRDIDECATNNGGCSINPRVPCINTYGSFHCGECPLGWSGDGRNCVRQSNPEGGAGVAARCAGNNICHPDAKCIEISNTVVCTCPPGMVGSGIGLNGCVRGTAVNCDSLPCLNGGTCVDVGNNFTCLCPRGFVGPTCTPIRNPCVPNPCHNDGRCRPDGGTQFTCQCAPGYTGRLCDKRFSRCGGLLVGTVGRLKYPLGSLYEHNAQCAWVIRTNETLVLNVTFNAFELEDSSECRFDWLQMNDGRTAAAQIIGRFCGSHKPEGGNIISSTNELYLWFRSDNSTSKEGFELEWNSIPPQCGGIIDVDSHGTIASPGSPGNYPKNRDCRWQLRGPNDKRLKLVFFSLEIEKHDSCNFDYLEIIDTIASVTVEKFCNTSHPAPLTLPTNEAEIHFHSDNEGSDLGFQIYYSLEERIPGCGGVFTAKEDTIKSPAAMDDVRRSCEYDIKLPVGESIKITFKKFEAKENDCIELYDIEPKTQQRILQSKYCGEYEVVPYILHSLFNAVRIKYYAKGAGGFELKYESDCSYTYQSEQDIITSPDYPNISGISRFCTYKIETEPNTVIEVRMIDFDIRDSNLEDDECLGSLRINDNMDKNIMGPFCGNSTPPLTFVSKTNMLIVLWQTGVTSLGKGFKLEYKAVPMGKHDCGGVYTKPSFSIRLPTDDDGSYLHDQECYWVIMAPEGKGIFVTWKSFNIEETMDCMYDYVEIYDNFANSEANALGRYCTLPPSFLSHSRILTVKFISDSSDSGSGFEFSYEFVDLRKTCGGDIFSSTGTIFSPEYPANYTPNVDCIWTISTPLGTQLELQVNMFELESSAKCESDWLEVRNGGASVAPLVGKYCGTSIPHTIPSFTNQMRVHFHSDAFVNARGFRISWYVFSNGCGGNIRGETGIITSPLYPNTYPHNAECEWHLQVPQGSAIHISIEDLEIEALFSCNYDFLEIFDGRSVNMPLLGKYCVMDEDEHIQLTTTGNDALVHFRTDGSQSERGFLLKFYANCTRELTEMVGVIESLNYNNPFYDAPINCTWTIKAPKGNKITLQFSHLEQQEGSTRDATGGLYLIDRDNQTASQKIVKKMTTNFNYTTTGDTLLVQHNSSLVNFRLEYRMFGCMQLLQKDSGEFESPNYPNMYPNDIECLWVIQTTPGRGIELTIDDLDIEDSVNCTNDALLISSNMHSTNPKERHCGKHDSLVMSVSSHRMMVKFSTNAVNNGKGFKASYKTLKSQCGGLLFSKNGVINSPNYPQNYPPKTDCEWTIEVTPFHSITLVMEEIDMENYYSCDMDYVEAYETPAADEEELTLFKECGLPDNKVREWRTKSNRVTVHFKSDESIQAKGFKLTFMENCGQRIMVDENSYEYITIARNGYTHEVCEWQLISTDLSKHIQLTPTHVQLNPLVALNYKLENDCLDAGVKVYDGIDDTAPLREKFCKTPPPAIISNGHALTIKVPLNVTSEFEAVFEQFDNNCGGFYQAIKGKFSSPFYPSSYPVNIYCEYFITASPGNSIVMTFEAFDIEDSEECNNDYLEVRKDNESGPLLGLFCGANVPGPIESPSTDLWLKFRSDDNNVGAGFLITYNYATHNEINGTNGTIESPRYPSKFHADEPYTWRIAVDKDYVVVLTIKHIIDVDIPFVKFYDGYSDIGLEIPYASTHIVRTTTNMLYIKASRGPFQFEWDRLTKVEMRANETAIEMARTCGKTLHTVGPVAYFSSPGYPDGYESSLNCSWVLVPSSTGTHVVAKFTKIQLEEFNECSADYVTVAASSDMQNWNELAKLCKLAPQTTQSYHGTPYLKLNFVTDSSINATGFAAQLGTTCGSEISDRQGFINITQLLRTNFNPTSECVWKIRVRQSRRIRIRFVESSLRLTNNTASCRTYFLLRNGFEEDSPFLGMGKYCDNNITDVLETTSNRAYIKFVPGPMISIRAAFTYEEISHECSGVVVLEDIPLERTKTITSPLYPNIPNPHSECVWRVEAPAHHVIRIEFIEKFDLATTQNDGSCDREYVQLNDGATELMPLLGVYCGTTKPSSKFTSGNVLRVKYYTDMPEPHAGFMAKVSLGQCGGAYYGPTGVILSPDKLRSNKKEAECVYTVEVEHGGHIRLTIEKMEFPDEESCNDTTHIELQEIDTYGEEENITDTLRLCGAQENRHFIVETNKLVVRYKVKDVALASLYSFRLTYKTVSHRCGETIYATRGTLYTPGYPNGVSRPTHCTWRIRVLKGRRVKLELLDFDTGATNSSFNSFGRVNSFRGRITFANDFQMQSIIARVSNNPPAAVYSTDNTMGIDAFLLPLSRHRGFKLRFSSGEPSQVCQHNFGLREGTVQFRRLNDTDTYCSYLLNVPDNSTLVLQVDKFEKGEIPHMFPNLCTYLSPLKLELNEHALVPDLFCRNETKPVVRVPYPVSLKLSGNRRNKLIELDLKYKMYECGGIWPVIEQRNLTQPDMGADFKGTVECAWALWPNYDFNDDNMENLEFLMADVQLEIKLTTDFKGKCEDQYLLLYNGPDQNSPHLGRYCSQASVENLVVERGMFMEYYSSSYETQSTFNFSVQQSSGCGGQLKYPYRNIVFYEQYKNNVECVWELATEPGFHLVMTLVGRFFIESSKDCKKDFLKVQQKNDSGEWVDLATICGRTPPAPIMTTRREMRVIFRSDNDTLGEGFTAEFERGCGGLLYATEEPQRISSPGYPEHYENNLFCNYTILSRKDEAILVRFLDFEVEEPPILRCMFDNVTIETVDRSDMREEAVFCGIHKILEFRGKIVSVVLRTDHSFVSKGFLLEYSTNACGGNIVNSTVIQSPRHHKHGNIPINSECRWNLTAPEDHKIILKFEELDFESHMDCAYDSVEVYKSLAPVENQRIARFCGNLTGVIPTLSIPSNKALIRSHTDGSELSKGFKVLVSFVPNCDRRIFLGADNDTYQFTTYADGYANNLDCSYVFATTPGRQLIIDFNKFHVEETQNCTGDYLMLNDGAGPFADEMARLCGHTMPGRLVSSRHTLYARFVSDSAETSSGFSATIKSMPAICGEPVRNLNGTEQIVLTSPLNDDGKLPRSTSCFWRIKAENQIHMKFDKFDLETTAAHGEGCGGNFLKFYNSEDAEMVESGYGSESIFNGQLVKQEDWYNWAAQFIYCNSHIPGDYFSTGKEVFIKFQTDNTVTGAGFQLTAMQAKGCFRNFTGVQGRIALAETVDHCDIYITAPDNYTLSLYYDEIMFAEYDCTLEYIEIFDKHTNVSLQKVCSFTEPGKSLFSSTNALFLRIKMSSYYTKFEITYVASKDGPGCGGNVYNTRGLITSPFYPNNVRNNSDCRWNIRVPSNLRVFMTFEVFDLGSKSTCPTDYVQIFEHNEAGREDVKRQFCGEDKPKFYMSEKNFVTLRFRKTQNYDGTGWVMKFQGAYANFKIPTYLFN